MAPIEYLLQEHFAALPSEPFASRPAFLLAGDPFTYVGRATAKLDAARLTINEESDHDDVHQRHFTHLQNDWALSRIDLRYQQREVFHGESPN